jgi:hypothetical protein
MVYCKLFYPPPYEAPLLWAAFLLIDFPASIIVIMVGLKYGSLYGPFGVPQFLCDYYNEHWLIISVIWPAIVFQLVGTVNWTICLWLYFWLNKKRDQPAE